MLKVNYNYIYSVNLNFFIIQIRKCKWRLEQEYSRWDGEHRGSVGKREPMGNRREWKFHRIYSKLIRQSGISRGAGITRDQGIRRGRSGQDVRIVIYGVSVFTENQWTVRSTSETS